MEDPPSKLIGQFLHKQRASGENALDMDLEMDELRNNNNKKNLPSVSESPVKTASSRELKVSFQQPRTSNAVVAESTNANNNESVRHRFNHDNNQNQEVVTCTSNASFQRKSSLLRVKTKSRLMDPPEEVKKRSSPRVPKSGQLRFGLLAKMDDDDDDPFSEEDLPNDFTRSNLSGLGVLMIKSTPVFGGAAAGGF